MFEAFYGFTTTPFSRQIAPENLFPSAQVKETLARLNYLVKTRGFGLLTGEVGAGKSTAVRALSHQLDPARYRVLYVSQSGLTPRHLYRELCIQMGLKPAFHAADARRQLSEALWDAYKNHDKQPVIIIDEGHLLSAAMLEEIRFLTNFQMDAASPMALILVGQTELRHRLRLQTFEAIAQRVNLRFHLTGLSAQETKAYIEHHLRVAGAKHALFSDEAVAVIYHFSKGIPRKINNICTACLLDGFLQEKSIIDEATARRALGEFEDDS